jgi:molecular chaperone DnaK (HSP70)
MPIETKLPPPRTVALGDKPAIQAGSSLRLRCRGCQKVCLQLERFCYACGAPLASLALSDVPEFAVVPNDSREVKIHVGNQGGGTLSLRARLVDPQRPEEAVPWARLQSGDLTLDQEAPAGTLSLFLSGAALLKTDARRCSLVVSANTRHEPRNTGPRRWDVWSRQDLVVPIGVKLTSPPRLRLNVDRVQLDLWSAEDGRVGRHLQMTNAGEGTLELDLRTDQPSLLALDSERVTLQEGRWDPLPARIRFEALSGEAPQTARIFLRDAHTLKDLFTATVEFRRREARDVGVVFGVDFGTSASKVATVMDGEVRVIRFASGDTWPSLLYVEKSIVRAVGPTAEKYVGKAGFIAGIKRLLVESDGQQAELDIATRNGGVEKLIGSFIEGLLEEVGANADVRKRWGDTMIRENMTLIATVPARARGAREDSMRRILGDLGMRNVRVLIESTAAAYLYARQEEYLPDGALVCVFDCGAGTTDVSVLRFSLLRNEEDGTYERVFEPIAEVGVERGGQDLDNAFYDVVKTRLNAAEQKALAQREKEERRPRSSKLLREIKLTKERLCAAEGDAGPVTLVAPGIVKQLELTRADFEQASREIVEEMVGAAWTALSEASERLGKTIDARRVEKCYLVGGTTYVPLIRSQLEEMFSARKVVGYTDRLTAVACGAVASLFPIRRVLSATYGYRRGKSEPVWFLFKGTVCPLTARQIPLAAGSAKLEIVERDDADQIRRVGDIDISTLSAKSDAVLHYEVDDQGILHASVRQGNTIIDMTRSG